MLNEVIVMGRLTKDPELRSTASGVSVTSFSIACDSDVKSADGEKITHFFDCIAWRSTAEFIDNYFKKGRMIIIKGKLQTDTWTDKEGKSRKSVKINAESVYFGDSKKDDSAASAPPTYQEPYSAAPVSETQTAAEQQEIIDDDLPF